MRLHESPAHACVSMGIERHLLCEAKRRAGSRTLHGSGPLCWVDAKRCERMPFKAETLGWRGMRCKRISSAKRQNRGSRQAEHRGAWAGRGSRQAGIVRWGRGQAALEVVKAVPFGAAQTSFRRADRLWRHGIVCVAVAHSRSTRGETAHGPGGHGQAHQAQGIRTHTL